MASPPSRTDLAGTPTVATYKLAIGGLYDYVASLLGNGTATIANETEKKLARESLGVGNFGFKNRLINPEFSVSQEFGFSSIGIVAGAGPKYLVDQWYATCAGANVSAQLINGISDNIFSLRLTGATANTAVVLGQRIEALNCYDLSNKQITVSLKAKSTSNKVVAWNVYYADVTDVFAAKTLVATGTINVTTSVEKFSFTFNAGSNAGNGLAVEFYVPNLLAGSTIDFDSVQLEQSAIATQFEKRSIQNELLLCLRYYESGQRRTRYIGNISNVLINSFFVEKRVTPTVSMYNGATANAINVSGSSVAVFGYSLSSSDYAVSTGVVGTTNVQYVATWTLFASARL